MFTHLHVHSAYSFLDGKSSIPELVAKAKELNMSSVALTDHGVMHGVIEFYQEAKKQGVHPIIGCEVYVAPGSRFHKAKSEKTTKNYHHLLLLAKNQQGYENLCELVSLGFTEGFYHKPRIDKELLSKYSEGLICTSACLGGPIPQKILMESREAGLLEALEYQAIFGKDNFYIELQDHGLKEQQVVNPQLIEIAHQIDAPIIVANDVHYLNKTDAKAHDVLLAIQTGSRLDNPNRFSFENDEFYFKSEEEMRQLFQGLDFDLNQAIENTNKIARDCQVDFNFDHYILPQFPLPKTVFNSFDYLRTIAQKGLDNLYPFKNEDLLKRFDYELEMIKQTGFTDYFLIVWDYIDWAQQQGILVGPGRGSAAGSLIAYCLGITKVDPIKHNLLFERFLNPERISMPDIDVDFQDNRRQEVIDYVMEKYGQDKTCYIGTFGLIKAKTAWLDVCRVYGIEPQEAQKGSKMIPEVLGTTLKSAYEDSQEFQEWVEKDELNQEIYQIALSIESIPRQGGVHAAGVIIADKPITKYAPIRVTDKNHVIQFSMNIVEKMGLLKMDFLGLRNLTVINDCVQAVRQHQPAFQIEHINYEDPAVYDMLSEGNTEGVFQFEGDEMTNHMMKLRPTTLEDLIAMVALYRPGPMENIPQYIENRHNPEMIDYLTPELQPILKDTHGIIVYQEQVMQIFQVLAGFSLARADVVRKAMSKKQKDILDNENHYFIYGCHDAARGIDIEGTLVKGISLEVSKKLIDLMESFASYAFNRSHAAAYAYIAYQTAYLKHYYPAEFMAATLSSVLEKKESLAKYASIAQRELKISVIPPDINESEVYFRALSKKIVFGLQGIEGVGKLLANAIVTERQTNGMFQSVIDFVIRMKPYRLDKVSFVNLIKAGAFDAFKQSRKALCEQSEELLVFANTLQQQSKKGVVSLFDLMETPLKERYWYPSIQSMKEWDESTLAKMEQEVTSLYLSFNPLENYSVILNSDGFMSLTQLKHAYDTGNILHIQKNKNIVALTGILQPFKERISKQGNRWASAQLQDDRVSAELHLFESVLQEFPETSEPTVVCVKATVTDYQGGKFKLRVNKIMKAPKNTEDPKILRAIVKQLGITRLVEEVQREKLTRKTREVVPSHPKYYGLYIKVSSFNDELTINAVVQTLIKMKGTHPVTVVNAKSQEQAEFRQYKVNLYDHENFKRLQSIVGESNVVRFRKKY